MSLAGEITKLGLVGTGVMGRGIAQVMAQAGAEVWLFDAREGAALAARGEVAKQLGRLVEKGKLDAAVAEATVARLHVAGTLAELAGVDCIVEAIVEDLDAKITLFRELEALVPATTILASNTSSLSITALAAGCAHPERVAGLHFFNPVPLMKVVEVIGGARTAPVLLERLTARVASTGHAAVLAQDTPGFIVNHAGRAYPTEALRIVGEGVAEFAQVDDVLREAAGFRLGPFELLDLTALDVSHPVMESIYSQYYQEPRYRPSVITRQRLAAGLLGRKVGQGFYAYGADGQRLPTEAGASLPREEKAPERIWVGGGEPQEVAALRALVAELGADVEAGERPSEQALCLVCPLGWDATSIAVALGLDATRVVAVDPLHGFQRRRTVMGTPVTAAAHLAAAAHWLAGDGVPVTTIRDSAGFISQRVLAMVVNLGADIVQQRVCSPADLDTAVRLGLGYPQGPLTWGDQLGPRRVLTILERLQSFYGDPRYRPSPWLKRRALLGVSLLQEG